MDLNPRIHKLGDSIWIESGICKVLKKTELIPVPKQGTAGRSRISFFKFQGTVQYDFLYRSLIDMPFYQKNYQQHTVQSSFNLVLKNTFPIRITTLARKANSLYFNDIADVNIQFQQASYIQGLKQELHNSVQHTITESFSQRINEIDQLYNQQQSKALGLQNWLTAPERVYEIANEKHQSLIQKESNFFSAIDVTGVPQHLLDEEEYKKMLLNKLTHNREMIADSILQKLQQYFLEKKRKIRDSFISKNGITQYREKEKELKKIKNEISESEKKLKSLKDALKDSLNRMKLEITNLNDVVSIKSFISRYNIRNYHLPKGSQIISSVKSLGLGRTWVDYTELTVKNVSLTGINIEITPSNFYFAFAAGRINYRFRDFVVQSNDRIRQPLYLLRAGIGRKEGNNFIFTYYSGRKSSINQLGNTPFSVVPVAITGLSAESRYRINENNIVVVEFAKSSHPSGITTNSNLIDNFKRISDFGDRSNESYSLQINSNWPKLNTRFTGYYRKTGEHFQSFNLLPVNTKQEAYNIKLQKQFWKNRIQIVAGIRKNDFSNPLVNPGFNSSMVFKSAQLSIRAPKYPLVMLGYFPSSQLTVLPNNLLVENQYNTLNATVGYSYKSGVTNMTTNILYLRFFNSSKDTGFVYYNATTLSAHQIFFLKKLQLQTGITSSSQRQLKIVTLEQSITYNLKEWISATGGLKYNKSNIANMQWGATAEINIVIKRIGIIQMSYDKSFLPGISRDLISVETGKLSLARSF